MSNVIDEILFEGSGLDSDRDYRYFDKGDAPYRLNILMAEDGAQGLITNLKGNKKVTYYPPENHPWLNANVYFTLCSYYDALTRNVYYWIFSQPVDTTGSGDYLYDNRLLRFNEDTEIIDTIFVDYYNYFGLDPTKPFKDSVILGDWLYFNPQESEPKMIHIDMAYNYTNYDVYDATETYIFGQRVTYLGGLFLALEAVAMGETPITTPAKWERVDDAYQDETNLQFDSEFHYAFNVIKYPPVYRILFSWGNDTDRSVNNLKGLVFKFAARYKYFDNTYSKYSAYSGLTLPIASEQYNGEIEDVTISSNYLALKIPLHSPALVKEVEVVFQILGGDWRLAKVINRKDLGLLNTAYFTWNFYNDESYPEIDDVHINDTQDSVPQKAKCQEIINKNILCYGGCTEGLDNQSKEDIDVSLTPELVEFEETDYEGATLWDNIVEDDLIYGIAEDPFTLISLYAYVQIFMADAFLVGLGAGNIYKIRIDGYELIYTLTAADVVSDDALALGIATAIRTLTPYYAINTGNIIEVDAPYNTMTITINDSIFYSNDGDTGALIKIGGFKTGAWHPFCKFYYDDTLRRCDAQTSKENIEGAAAWEILGTTVYVPMLGEYSPAVTGLNYKWNINWEVNDLPPSYAKYWRWGYAGNSLCSYFVRYTVTEVGDVGAASATEPINTTYIDISPLQTLMDSAEANWNKYPNSIIAPYVWESGDRVRFITEKSAGNNIGAVLDGIYDFEIISQDTTTHRIYVQEFGWNAVDIGEDTLIEIYKPLKRDTETVFYEFGELMPIVEDANGILVHGAPSEFNNQDSFAGTPATGTFTWGDVYHILRTPSKPINGTEGYVHESQWYSDFYDSADWDKGKTGYETLFNQRYLNIVRFSNQYLQNTQINGLSTFDGDDYVELNDIYGNILRIIENGDTLKVYQRKKPSSLMIGRTQYYDSEGQANVQVLSDRILSQPRYSTTNYGTEYPESISRNNRYIYGFDIYNGVMWRDSPNGIFPISGRYEAVDGTGDYKMQTWFKQKAKDLLISGVKNTSVLTAWDERHKNLYVIFKDSFDADNNDAIIFHEPSNRWICFTDMGYTPANGWNEILELDYSILLGFDGGLDYEFDEDTRFTVFTLQSTAEAEEFIEGTLIVDEDGTTYIVTEELEFIIE